jgi:hypothetical protein
MRHMNIQVQPERSGALDMLRLKNAVQSLANDRGLIAGFEVKEGDDEGPYVNFTFAAHDAARLWTRIKDDLLQHPDFGGDLSHASIVICEGEHGWDDYLLLHHFDPKYPLDDAEGL